MAIQQALQGLSHSGPMMPDSTSRLTARVVLHIERLLDSDQIDAGGRLPSERTLALDIGVSRNTVTAAYSELEQRGLIRRIRGKGAFKCSPAVAGGAAPSFSWSGKVSSKAHLLDEPVLEMLARGCSAGVPYPLSAGTPSLECFPTQEYRDCANAVIDSEFPQALAVAPTEGQSKLRHSIANWTNVSPNHVMITSGAQEAIDLLARCLIEPGDYAIVESPTYPGAIQCLRAAGARLIGWETDWSLPKLEQMLLRYRPKVIFTMPTFQNPTGKVMSLATRQGLLDLAARYHVPIIEDDVYSKTFLNGKTPPDSLMKLDQHSLVIYLSTFSKMLAPGLRVGWIVAPHYMVKQLSLMKMRANLFTGGLNQLVLSRFIDNGGFDKHLTKLRQHHRALRDAAVTIAQSAADDDLLSFTPPAGGLYLWCKLNPQVDIDLLLEKTEAKGLTVAPGHAFFPEKSSQVNIRLCFTPVAEAKVAKGVGVLRDTLRQMHNTLPQEPILEPAARIGPPASF